MQTAALAILLSPSRSIAENSFYLSRLCPRRPIITRTCPAQLTCRPTRCNNLHSRFCRTKRQKLWSTAPVLREMLLRTPPVNWRRWGIRTCGTTLKASRTGLTPGYLLRASTNTNLLALTRIKEMSDREVNKHEGLESIVPNYGSIVSRNGREFTDTHTAQFTYWSWGL